MKTATRLSHIAILATLIGTSAACTPAPEAGMAMPDAKAELALREGMRKLWADHVIWTRQYIVATVAGDPSAKQAADRLLKNQEDIGKAIEPYYGGDAARKLTELLKAHITTAVDVVAAAKAGDKTKLAAADKRWHDNAAEIATFLSGANPNWPKDALTDMLNEHLAVTTDEAVARIGKKWDDDVSAFDKIFTQAMMMADALSDGIIKQFPAKFTTGA